MNFIVGCIMIFFFFALFSESSNDEAHKSNDKTPTKTNYKQNELKVSVFTQEKLEQNTVNKEIIEKTQESKEDINKIKNTKQYLTKLQKVNENREVDKTDKEDMLRSELFKKMNEAIIERLDEEIAEQEKYTKKKLGQSLEQQILEQEKLESLAYILASKENKFKSLVNDIACDGFRDCSPLATFKSTNSRYDLNVTQYTICKTVESSDYNKIFLEEVTDPITNTVVGRIIAVYIKDDRCLGFGYDEYGNCIFAKNNDDKYKLMPESDLDFYIKTATDIYHNYICKDTFTSDAKRFLYDFLEM